MWHNDIKEAEQKQQLTLINAGLSLILEADNSRYLVDDGISFYCSVS